MSIKDYQSKKENLKDNIGVFIFIISLIGGIYFLITGKHFVSFVFFVPIIYSWLSDEFISR